MKVELNDVIKVLSETCFCSECGETIGCHSHFCEKCKKLIAEPIEGDLFAKFLIEKYGSVMK